MTSIVFATRIGCGGSFFRTCTKHVCNEGWTEQKTINERGTQCGKSSATTTAGNRIMGDSLKSNRVYLISLESGESKARCWNDKKWGETQRMATKTHLITSVAQPLLAECVQGLLPPPQLVHATISFGPPVSRFLSPCKWATYLILNIFTRGRQLGQ